MHAFVPASLRGLCAHLGGHADRSSQQQSVVLVLRSARPQAPCVRQMFARSTCVQLQMPDACVRVHGRQFPQPPEVRGEQREAACRSASELVCRVEVR